MERFESAIDDVKDMRVLVCADPIENAHKLEIWAKSGDQEYLYRFIGPGVRNANIPMFDNCIDLAKENEKLQQENKKLKEAYEKLQQENTLNKETADTWSREYHRLSIENEKLKKDLKEIQEAFPMTANKILYGEGELKVENKDTDRVDVEPVSEFTESEEDDEMKLTSVWKIKDIDNIWTSREGDKMSLMLKNKDELISILMTGEAIKNHNDNFVIALKADIKEDEKKMYKLEKENEKLKKELEERTVSAVAAKEKNKLLEIENEKLKKELHSLKTLKKSNLPETPITDAMLVDDYLKLTKENEELKKDLKEIQEAFPMTANKILYGEGELKVENKDTDNVNHPSHYETGKFECIEVMQEVFGIGAVINFCKCNAFKYVYRMDRKNGTEDAKKAIWYLNKYLELQNELVSELFDDGGEIDGERHTSD